MPLSGMRVPFISTSMLVLPRMAMPPSAIQLDAGHSAQQICDAAAARRRHTCVHHSGAAAQPHCIALRAHDQRIDSFNGVMFVLRCRRYGKRAQGAAQSGGNPDHSQLTAGRYTWLSGLPEPPPK